MHNKRKKAKLSPFLKSKFHTVGCRLIKANLPYNSLIRSSNMVKIYCGQDQHCPYEYYCNSSNQCIHDPVFPLTLYPILIYCLFPIASAICNTSGNSFGEFKVIFLMDLLDYTESAATVLTYPLTVGTALFNFITLIFRRHPSKPTSVVDYNIVMIIIPSVLYGSTIGALTNKFVPPIIADSLIILILASFSVKFFLRFYNFRKQGKLQQQQKQVQLETVSRQIEITEVQDKIMDKVTPQQLERRLIDQGQVKRQTKRISVKDNEVEKVEELPNNCERELEEQLEYEKSYHLPHIFATCIIFVIFEGLSFLAQGKIIFFTICSEYYPIGMAVLTVVFITFLILMYYYTKEKMAFYRRIQYKYEYKLDTIKFFVLVVLSSFLGGFNGGVFGVGSSTTMIFSLLYLEIQPVVVSATVGYQVVFGGMGSLCEALVTDQITLDVAGFFFGITFVIGGALSFLSITFVKKLNENKRNQVLMLIVGFLTGFSTLALIGNIILSYRLFGAEFMISSPFQC